MSSDNSPSSECDVPFESAHYSLPCRITGCVCLPACNCCAHNPYTELEHKFIHARTRCTEQFNDESTIPGWMQNYYLNANLREEEKRHKSLIVSSRESLFMQSFEVEDYRNKYYIFHHFQDDLISLFPVFCRFKPEWLSNGGLIGIASSWLSVLQKFLPSLTSFSFRPSIYNINQKTESISWGTSVFVNKELVENINGFVPVEETNNHRYHYLPVKGEDIVSYFSVETSLYRETILDDFYDENDQFVEDPSILMLVSENNRKCQVHYFKMLIYRIESLRDVYRRYGFDWISRAQVDENNLLRYSCMSSAMEHIFLKYCKSEVNKAMIAMLKEDMHCFCEEKRPTELDGCCCSDKEAHKECCVEDALDFIYRSCDGGYRFRKVKCNVRPCLDEEDEPPRKIVKSEY